MNTITIEDFQRAAHDGATAQKIARLIDARARRNPNVSRPELLRQLRDEAARGVVRAEEEEQTKPTPLGCTECDCAEFLGTGETCERDSCKHGKAAHTKEQAAPAPAEPAASVRAFRPKATIQDSGLPRLRKAVASILTTPGAILAVNASQAAEVAAALGQCRGLSDRLYFRARAMAHPSNGPTLGRHYLKGILAEIDNNSGPQAA